MVVFLPDARTHVIPITRSVVGRVIDLSETLRISYTHGRDIIKVATIFTDLLLSVSYSVTPYLFTSNLKLQEPKNNSSYTLISYRESDDISTGTTIAGNYLSFLVKPKIRVEMVK